MTFLHGVSEWARPDFFLPPPFPMPVEVHGHDGTRVESRECCPVSGYSGVFGRFEAPLRESGALTDFRFGDAPSLFSDARLNCETVSAILKQTPEIV
jgi:hypothetical protein